jgi:hypothetical protein
MLTAAAARLGACEMMLGPVGWIPGCRWRLGEPTLLSRLGWDLHRQGLLVRAERSKPQIHSGLATAATDVSVAVDFSDARGTVCQARLVKTRTWGMLGLARSDM